MAQHEGTRRLAMAREALINDPEFLRDVVQGVLQRFLEAETSEHLRAAPHQRTEARKGYLNGYRPRQLKTRVGRLDLLVPQDRDGTFKTDLFDRNPRSEKALVLSLMEMYVEELSTRKVKDVTERLCGTTFSKSQVSRLATGLDADLEAWRRRPLGGTTYPYLIVDARYEHVGQAGEVVSQGVLVVMAVRNDGRRDLLAVKVADAESQATYEELFDDLITAA